MTFPQNKYHFDDYLIREGDFIVTHPMSMENRRLFKKAADQWAWVKRKTIRVSTQKTEYGLYEVKVEVLKTHRERDYE